MQSEASRIVGVVIERRPARSRWVDHVWRVVDILDGAAGSPPFAELPSPGEGCARFFIGNAVLKLHRGDTDDYRINLEGDRVVYVIMRNSGDRARPFMLHAVTASPREACDRLDSSEETVETVAMSPSILEWVEAFHALHHKEEAFVKRRRERVDMERLQFSKEPIFARTGRFPGGGSGGE